MAQFAYNAAKQETTQFSPFYANFGREPVFFQEPIRRNDNDASAQKQAKELESIHRTIKRDIEFLNIRIAMYYDQRHQEMPQLQEGDKVYLLSRNLKTTRPNKKLDYKKLGPFKIIRQVSKLSYKLDLPVARRRGRKQHDVFHVSLLEPAPSDLRINRDAYNIQIVLEEELEDDLFEADYILD